MTFLFIYLFDFGGKKVSKSEMGDDGGRGRVRQMSSSFFPGLSYLDKACLCLGVLSGGG